MINIDDINSNTESIDGILKSHETIFFKNDDLLKFAQVYRLSKDAEGIFQIIQWKNKDTGKLLKQQELSGGTSPNYTTLTITYYKDDGTTADVTKTYTINYDSDGDYEGVI